MADTTDRNDEFVQDALEVVQDNFSLKNEQDAKNRAVQDLLESGFVIRRPKSPQFITSKMIQQARLKVINRMKPLDFSVHSPGRPELIERMVSAGLGTVLKLGKYPEVMRGKNGVFDKIILYSDAWFWIGTHMKKKHIKFQTFSNSNLFFDRYATTWRGTSQRVTRAVGVLSMSKSEAKMDFPDLTASGAIPRKAASEIEELERRQDQQVAAQTDYVEIAYGWDIAKRRHVIFAGSECEILDKRADKEFMWVLDDEPYIPLIHNYCIPSTKGFYNHGLGDVLYDLAILTRKMLNLGYGHMEESVWPITLLNVPKGKSGQFFNKIAVAHEMRAKGFKAWVPVEYNEKNPNSGRVNPQALVAPALMQEWQILDNRLTQELKRLGIVLDDVQREGEVTATEILSDDENTTSFVKQMAEFNASEHEMCMNIALDLMKKTIKKNDDTPLDLSTKIQDPETGQEIPLSSLTLGAVADELRKYKYYVRVNARTGAIPSNVMQQAQIRNALSVAQPGSKAFIKLSKKLMDLNDQDVSLQDLGMPPPGGAPGGAQGASGAEGGAPPAGGGGQAAAPEAPAGSETDRMSISAQAARAPVMP